ncbi:MAG: Ku protein [Tepidiformaceae bacterium]
MPRSMWAGAISFGLVNVPVKLYTAARSKDIRFNQLHEADGARINMKRVCAEDGQEVPFGEIVKGYEVSPDHYVMITPEELDSLAPEMTRSIDISEFVDLADIDPVYYESSYFLTPDKSGVKAYGLLMKAMEQAGKVAIGRIVLRSKQYVVAVRPSGNALCMSTLYFADEVVEQDSLDLPEKVTFDERELAMAQQLISALSEKFDPEKYHDDYREKVLDMIERKSEGEEVVLAPRTEAKPKVVDLMAALEASIAAAKGGGKKSVVEEEKETVAAAPRSSRKTATKAAPPSDEAKPAKLTVRSRKSA